VNRELVLAVVVEELRGAVPPNGNEGKELGAVWGFRRFQLREEIARIAECRSRRGHLLILGARRSNPKALEANDSLQCPSQRSGACASAALVQERVQEGEVPEAVFPAQLPRELARHIGSPDLEQRFELGGHRGQAQLQERSPVPIPVLSLDDYPPFGADHEPAHQRLLPQRPQQQPPPVSSRQSVRNRKHGSHRLASIPQ